MSPVAAAAKPDFSADRTTAAANEAAPLSGLTSQQAKDLLVSVGANAMPDGGSSPWRRIVGNVWAPVPWMLEAAIFLQLCLRQFNGAIVIAGLLLFNATISFLQEGRAQATLAALKSRLAMNASVQRDGAWKIIPSVDLVPGDLIKLSLGAVVAADVHLLQGSVLLDQSMLTGESVPVDAGKGADTFAGALVKRGEATARVMQTGARTTFGHTAELVQTADVVSSQQKTVLLVVRNLALLNGLVIVALVVYASIRGMGWSDIVPLVLTAVLAAIPVALPATFTLASALGARSLAKLGVLPTRLSAISEAATMDVLCVDKTGTLTLNTLRVCGVRSMDGSSQAHVLALAALASADGGQDPVDMAIQAASASARDDQAPTLDSFLPFDPARKMSEARITDQAGVHMRVVKGACETIMAQAPADAAGMAALAAFTAQGFRMLAVAAGPEGGKLTLAGLIALTDPPRPDAKAFIAQLNQLGVCTIMVTGDAPATASVIARDVGLTGKVSPSGAMADDATPEQFSVFAGIFPEGKYNLVKAFQKAGHTVGMCGDGANDAPALRQAQMGVAVSTATDVAKSAAGIVLTTAGLSGVVDAVREGRAAFQRILTYTINSVTKKIVNVLFLTVGLIVTGHAILTPMLMVIIMITGDFLGMSVTADNVHASAIPNRWHIGRLTRACMVLGACLLAFSTGALLIGHFWLKLDTASLQTFSMILLVFGGEAMLYATRERRRLWSSMPGCWVIAATVFDIAIITILATRGIAMHPLSFGMVASTFLATAVFAFLLDLIKVPTFRRFQIV
jgi:H+-transporting ATPase